MRRIFLVTVFRVERYKNTIFNLAIARSNTHICHHGIGIPCPNRELLYFCIMESTRQQKIARLIQRDLSEMFQRKARDLFPGNMITVTKVHISPDLSYARSYLSLFGKIEKNELLKQINMRKKEIRRELGNRIHNQVRIIPELEFFIDDSLDYIENIENLLKD
jgi:ribosome-binding factor A